jgi:glycosyltransferase involved in cell wall biosynthesis
MPSIAVIIPNRNDARYIPRCLDSVLRQDVKPDELVIVDDQSTDNSVAVIRRKIGREPRARLITNSANVGTSEALNIGVRETCSDYVMLLSSNDFVLPGLFARAKSCLGRSPNAGVWSALSIIVDDSGIVLGLQPTPIVALKDAYFTPAESIRLAHKFGNWFGQPTMTYKRSALIELGMFDPMCAGLADLIVALGIASRYGAIFSPEIFGAIRIHGGGLASRTLSKADTLKAVLGSVSARGAAMNPGLFNGEFLNRFARRICFSAVRGTGDLAMGYVALKDHGMGKRLLEAADRLLPSRMKAARVILSFVILRPFDIWPTFFYRYCGKALVLAKTWIRGRRLAHLVR